MIRSLAATVLLPLAAASADPLAGRVAGKPTQCISLGVSDGLQIVDERTIQYRSGARIYRTQPIGACPALGPFTTLIVDVYGNQICRNDRFRTVEMGQFIPSAYCRFGEFTPYERVKERTD